MSQSPNSTLFIGGGNMGLAILRGFRSSGGDMDQVSVVDPFLDAEVAVELGLSGLFHRIEEIPEDKKFGTILLAVKPQIFETLGSGWAVPLSEGGLVISIMAGVASSRIARSAGKPCVVARCMPNMAAAVGQSVNVAHLSEPSHKEQFEALISGSGPVRWVDNEDHIHMTTAVSGSGPAYFFAFVEALALAGEQAGLDPELALDLSIDTLIGAAELLKTNRSPASLRESVTSKGGTTAAALSAFATNNNLKGVVGDGVNAAVSRSRELSQ